MAFAQAHSFARLLEPLERVLSNGFEHVEASVRMARVRADKGVADESIEQVHDLCSRELLVVTHLPDAVHGEAAAENRDAAEEDARGLGEQVEAPGDGGTQGLVSLGSGTQARGQQSERV